MMNVNDLVTIKDKAAIDQDVHMDDNARAIIQTNDYMGTVTKVDGDVYFVGFDNHLGWVTLGFHADQIEVIGL